MPDETSKFLKYKSLWNDRNILRKICRINRPKWIVIDHTDVNQHCYRVQIDLLLIFPLCSEVLENH